MENNLKNNINIIIYYAAAAATKSLQSCPTLSDPIHSSLPGSPIPGIFQARTLELTKTVCCMPESNTTL